MRPCPFQLSQGPLDPKLTLLRLSTCAKRKQVATILGLDLAKVPNFIEASADPYDSLRTFLDGYGMGFVKMTLDEQGRFPFHPGGPCDCILAGPSPRGDFRHAVVGRCDLDSRTPVCVFDPHHDDTFFNEKPAVWAGVFVCLKPANVILNNEPSKRPRYESYGNDDGEVINTVDF